MVSIASAIVIGLIAAFIQSLGLTLQRKSHLENEIAPAHQPDWKRPLWVIGFLIFIISNTLGSVFQLGALPIVVLAPLGGVSLIWNALFAKLILGDRFSRYLILGTILIATGAVLIAVFGTIPEPNHSLDELLVLYARPPFVAFLSVLTFLVAVVLILAHVADWRMARRRTAPTDLKPHRGPSHSRRWSEPVRSSFSSDTMLKDYHPSPVSPVSPNFAVTIFHETEAALTETRLWIGIAYGSVSGTLSGLCLLFAKTGTELFILSLLGHQNQFRKWQSYMIVVVMLVAAVLQLWYLNRSLRLLGPTLICPLAFCFYNLSSILNGLVFYDQWRLLPAQDIVLVSVGIAVLLVGVWIVSLKSDDTAADEPDLDDERTPLLFEEPEPFQEEEGDDAESIEGSQVRRPFGLESLKRLLRDRTAGGLAIGIAAPSPGGSSALVTAATDEKQGFAVRPRPKHHDQMRSGDLSSSMNSLPSDRAPHRSASLRMSTSSSPTFDLSHSHALRRKRRSLGGALYVGLDPVEPPVVPPLAERKPFKSSLKSWFGLD